MTVRERISGASHRLSPSERRVAEVVAAEPESVAFGTVASIAARARTSGPTVVRTASRLGFDGFVQLQAAVQEELAGRLRPAADAIRRRPARDPVQRALVTETRNVHDTLAAVDADTFSLATQALADRRSRVGILSGEATVGVARVFADTLGMVRPGVRLLAGTEVRVFRELGLLDASDTVVAMDVRRYERWVLRAARRTVDRGLEVIAITDGLLSPLAELARHVFVVSAVGPGPFDSHVGTLALCNTLVAGTAARMRRTATGRLDRVEDAWRQAQVLTDG